MDLAKEILGKFEDFIKRSLFPSSVFFVLFIGIGFIADEAKKSSFYTPFVKLFTEQKNSTFELFSVVVVFIGVSYILTIMMQMFYDNNIKKNYNTFLFWTDENKELDKLRRKVVKEIISDNNVKAYSDYMLYQLLVTNNENTSRYVDEVKSIGIFFLSLIFSSFYWLCLSALPESCILGIILSIAIYILGCDVIKTRYRSRAIRIYINYLANKSQ